MVDKKDEKKNPPVDEIRGLGKVTQSISLEDLMVVAALNGLCTTLKQQPNNFFVLNGKNLDLTTAAVIIGRATYQGYIKNKNEIPTERLLAE